MEEFCIGVQMLGVMLLCDAAEDDASFRRMGQTKPMLTPMDGPKSQYGLKPAEEPFV